MLFNGWHSDKTGERRMHTVMPLFCAGLAYLLLLAAIHNFPAALLLLLAGGGFMFAYYPVFWSMPAMILTESAAAATFGLINSIGHTGGFFGPTIVGYLNTRTGTLRGAFAFTGACYLLAAVILLLVRIRAPGPEPAPLGAGESPFPPVGKRRRPPLHHEQGRSGR
jgi:nitrate/nitrite transporter NarK